MKVDIWIIGKPFDHCLQLFPKALQKMPAGSRSPVASVPILRMRSRLQVPTAFFRPRKAPAKPCRTPKLKQNLIAFVRTRRAEEVGSQWSARSDGPTGLRVDGGGSQARLRQNNGLQLRLEMSSAEERDRQQKQYKKIKCIMQRHPTAQYIRHTAFCGLRPKLCYTVAPLRPCSYEVGSNCKRSFEIGTSHLLQ